MNYLDRLRQIDGQKIFVHAPETELTKLTKAPFVSSGSTAQGICAKTQSKKAQSEKAANADGIISFAWLMHFIDRNSLIVTFSPEIRHAGALACYPDAVAAEPMPAPSRRSATNAEAVTLRQLVAAVYRDDSDDDRSEVLQAALADPDNALACYRAIASERGDPLRITMIVAPVASAQT